MKPDPRWQEVELSWRPADPNQVWQLAAAIVDKAAPGTNIMRVARVYRDVLDLFSGSYPGYQVVRTPYHNLGHTLGVFLCTARLLHGAALAGLKLLPEDVEGSLVAALLHDSGYALADSEGGSSGAELTEIHVDRGVDFMRRYFSEAAEDQLVRMECAIRCTDPRQAPKAVVACCGEARLAGHLVGTADLVSQMADRDYLERLLFLYYEFRDARYGDYENVHALLARTVDFYALARKRIYEELGGSVDWLKLHFLDWLGVDANLYMEAIEKNMAYLDQVLRCAEEDRLAMLKRGGIVERARKLGAL